MKALTTRRSMLLAATAMTLAPLPTFAAGNVTPDEARKIARDAYIFAYPLALQYRTMYVQAIDAKSKEYVGGFGIYRHYGMSGPDNKDIVTPNNDTPYSWAHVDLRAEPWVLTQPKSDGRYITAEWMDLWHLVLDNPGTVLDGSSGGSYLLASPRWKGTVPKGIKRVVRGESDFIGTLTRTGTSGPADLPNLQATQAGYTLQPLSKFLGKPAPQPAAPLDFPAWVPEVDKTADIFRYVNFMLPYTVPQTMDKPMLARIARIGIAPAKPWDLSKLDPAMRQAIEDGVADGLKKVNDTIPTVLDSSKLFGDRKKMGKDYLNRTLGVVMGQWGNVAQQAVYQTWPTDAEGQALDSSKNRYQITFAPGKLPHAKYFWSITMYNLPERLLVDNPLKRYSIGSQTPELKKAADGSVTILVQKDSPGKDLEGNWLPAPNAPFFAVLRVYGPGPDEQTAKWKAPQVHRVK